MHLAFLSKEDLHDFIDFLFGFEHHILNFLLTHIHLNFLLPFLFLPHILQIDHLSQHHVLLHFTLETLHITNCILQFVLLVFR